jgi:hypothetical protein
MAAARDEGCTGGGFDGVLDVFIHVGDVEAALVHVDRVAASLTIANDLYVDCYPPCTFAWRATLRHMP